MVDSLTKCTVSINIYYQSDSYWSADKYITDPGLRFNRSKTECIIISKCYLEPLTEWRPNPARCTHRNYSLIKFHKKTYSSKPSWFKKNYVILPIERNEGPYPDKWHVFVLALLYLFECLNEWRPHSDRLQLLETSVGNVIRFRKRRIMTKCR